ncbi:MAG: ATP-binding protein [Bacteroidetes bacterium]|nr:ATP-binding protein [Bacteroidota bacterium]
MNTQATLQKMQAMRLHGMQQAYQNSIETKSIDQLTKEELLAYLVDAEWQDRENRRIERLTNQAKFRYKSFLEEIDYNTPRDLNKDMLIRLADCSFIKKSENVLITGPTGVGKSFITSALGHQACIYGYKTYYINANKLFAKLKASTADGSYIKEINKIEKQDLLIIDDFGLQPLDNHNRQMLMEIIEDRHNRKSTIISSQLPVKSWHEVIGESTIADAILDRLIHSAHRITLKGESMRKINSIEKKR